MMHPDWEPGEFKRMVLGAGGDTFVATYETDTGLVCYETLTYAAAEALVIVTTKPTGEAYQRFSNDAKV